VTENITLKKPAGRFYSAQTFNEEAVKVFEEQDDKINSASSHKTRSIFDPENEEDSEIEAILDLSDRDDLPHKVSPHSRTQASSSHPQSSPPFDDVLRKKEEEFERLS